ncbi:FAD-dependent monooxygenase [Mycolicibacterium litorale]|uniref:Flavin-dependent oxidoreductase n=1 Tax=Mycolicibacterium litorale TaxID=758802 RepID=A0AAD1IHG9_9MYCO|nr:FAD-dependent monooxygenase [Mycolicibacterium litorale]MCV7414151.1 FAD-dependent monooxygenase [Mycolicibacterium litorale]TDY02157.1 2-polyprenyl-6-methoxyphenol hydroxylase-like FAD-dependent oxidoreductase [Mycolicibacterium litorale]BBY15662.1 flavin-dependent oxidoreductase [Mycolicibacterium litorale]
MNSPRVLVAGAGIGGLTAALTLHQRGFAVAVVERARELKPLGVGINLLPHAVAELERLGLADRVASVASAPSAISFFDSTGRHLFREPRGLDGGYGHPQLSVHRGVLQSVLAGAVAERLGPGAVRLGWGLTGFTERADGVVAHTAGGDLRADVLVGADGVDSVVREILHPQSGPLMWSGIRMFRGAARRAPFLDGRTMAIVKGPGEVDLVTYPIGGALVNWVLQVPGGRPGPLPGDAGWNRPADRSEVRRHVRDWRLDWLDVEALIDHTDDVFEYPMVDRDPLPRWGTERVTLLGDAAHPMYPVGANGGSQAIVDARVLADELTAGPGGLGRYETRRCADTAAVVAANRTMHRAGASRRPEDLERVTAQYRHDTARSYS